jgi:hypothetical protein
MRVRLLKEEEEEERKQDKAPSREDHNVHVQCRSFSLSDDDEEEEEDDTFASRVKDI